MPYIITTRKQFDTTADTERAVATLDEAHEHAMDAVSAVFGPEMMPAPWWEDVRALPEAGGTVGPLPDGTVIEVQPVEWLALRERAGLNPVYDGAELTIIDVFNAR